MKMRKEDLIRIYGGLEELRQKQVSKGLSSTEERKLESLLTEAEVDEPDIRQSQWESPVNVFALKNERFKEQPVKRGLLQRLFQRDYPEYHRLIMTKEEDFIRKQWPFPFILELRQFMEEAGLGWDWPKMLPVTIYQDIFEHLTDEDLDWFKQLPDPNWSQMKFLEIEDMEMKAAAHSKEMLEAVRWLRDHWDKGYKIYLDLTELFFF
ncbi:hypothetical protein [Siminovitchia fordii]|uniref:Uncharacterized protein n=1 Tax=Siminovitchia fordii TaxID=254759 RepID=A0ABQ4K445_9BACI|nr:hypothetical protein [Siminovitchia fordii]GIN20515.1 hypothetical protein J1TS3_16490 [Siminovitchia fordii]